MNDPSYSGDIFMDSSFLVKQEQVSMDTSTSTSASVPIPPRKVLDLSELRDFGFDLEYDNPSPSVSQSVPVAQCSLFNNLTGTSLWGTKLDADSVSIKTESFKMDDDDIFQVDKADLIQGPTLAELNANEEILLDDLNFDDLLLPEENTYMNVSCISPLSKTSLEPPVVQITNSNSNVTNNNQPPSSGTASSFPPAGFGFYKDPFLSSSVPSSPMDMFSKAVTCATPGIEALSPASHHSSSSSLLLQSASSVTPPPQEMGAHSMKHSTLHELLMKKETSSSSISKSLERSISGQMSPTSPMETAGSSSVNIAPGASRFSRGGSSSQCFSSRLSSSAPTHLGLEQIWQRREPRQHLLSTGSLAEAGSTSSISTGGVLSPEPHEFSHDEGFDSEDDSDHYEDYSSDGESDSDNESGARSMSKKERYFWQYNVQAKGPKGQRLVLKTTLEDPHVLNEVTDPVFSPECSVRGIKHSGKARKGDGNDLTPNPRKLWNIGKELDKLGQVINDMTPVSELPFNVRPKTRKEKNKLASRACRLKKKAQHEANKLKLHGLEVEHRRLNNAIVQIKQILVAKCTTEDPEKQEEYTKQIDKISKQATKLHIAGHTIEFVNRVLEKVKSGTPSGGLEEL